MAEDQAHPDHVTQQALHRLVLDTDLAHLEDLLAEFNPFEVLGIQRRETLHSAFLAWLLDPRGSHGVGDHFLRRFLLAVVAKGYDDRLTDLTPLAVDNWSLDAVRTITESDNIDILIVSEDDQFACIIENKIGAAEHDDQLTRYYDTTREQLPDFSIVPIFLTPDGRDPVSAEDAEIYIPFDYNEVAELVAHTMEARSTTLNDGVRHFLSQYYRTLRRYVTAMNDNINELALQIYNNHRDAIDLIFRARATAPLPGWNVLDGLMSDHHALIAPDDHAANFHRYYSGALEEIHQLKGGSGWTSTGRMLLFELRYHQRHLSLIIGPGPADIRRRVYELTQSPSAVPGVQMRSVPRLSPNYHTIYRKRLLTKGSSQEPDYHIRPDEPRLGINEFFQNDYWPIVNAVRGAFGYPVVD